MGLVDHIASFLFYGVLFGGIGTEEHLSVKYLCSRSAAAT
jgi:hypothetical protein